MTPSRDSATSLLRKRRPLKLRQERSASLAASAARAFGSSCWTVDLDDHLLRQASEIDDVAGARHLSAEMISVAPQFAQLPPELRFRDCLVLAEMARD